MNYIWLLALPSIVMAFIGCFTMLISSRRTKKPLSTSLLVLFLASLFGVTTHTIIPVMGFMGVGSSSNLWNLVPYTFLGAAILVVISNSQMLKIFDMLSKQDFEENESA